MENEKEKFQAILESLGSKMADQGMFQVNAAVELAQLLGDDLNFIFGYCLGKMMRTADPEKVRFLILAAIDSYETLAKQMEET